MPLAGVCCPSICLWTLGASGPWTPDIWEVPSQHLSTYPCLDLSALLKEGSRLSGRGCLPLGDACPAPHSRNASPTLALEKQKNQLGSGSGGWGLPGASHCCCPAGPGVQPRVVPGSLQGSRLWDWMAVPESPVAAPKAGPARPVLSFPTQADPARLSAGSVGLPPGGTACPEGSQASV